MPVDLLNERGIRFVMRCGTSSGGWVSQHRFIRSSQLDAHITAANESNYRARFHECKYQKFLFDLLLRQYEIARVDESCGGAVMQIVDRALPPERKTKPKKTLIAFIATVAMGLVLLLFVFLNQALCNAGNNAESAVKLQQLRQ